MRLILQIVWRFSPHFLVTTFGFTQATLAITSVRWLPFDQQALVVMRNAGDNDPGQVYKMMNVPPVETQYGRGKSLATAEDTFTLVCDEKGARCDMVFIQGPFIAISHRKARIEVQVNDAPAEEMRKLFVLDANNELNFASEDDRFFMKSKPGQFSIVFQDK